jgi:hypothetical protein
LLLFPPFVFHSPVRVPANALTLPCTTLQHIL